MIVKESFEALIKRVQWGQGTEPNDEYKRDLAYAFFLAGAGGMVNGVQTIMERGKTLEAQAIAHHIVTEAEVEILKLQTKYLGKAGFSGVNMGEFKL